MSIIKIASKEHVAVIQVTVAFIHNFQVRFFFKCNQNYYTQFKHFFTNINSYEFLTNLCLQWKT